jgi:hypothetical protein
MTPSHSGAIVRESNPGGDPWNRWCLPSSQRTPLRATDTPGSGTRKSLRRDWRAVAHAWGPPGNHRLTASVSLVLVVLLAVEALTTLALRSYLSVHIFLGLLLLPPLALKLASAAWRFMRYYTGDEPYRVEGPPKLLLRSLAPLLVASTLTLFGSGVALIVVGRDGGLLLSLHSLSFVVWGILIVVHVLAYLVRTLRVGTADWRRRAEVVVAGSRSRRAALSGALLAGVILALATYPAQRAWLNHHREHRDADALAGASAKDATVPASWHPGFPAGVASSWTVAVKTHRRR